MSAEPGKAKEHDHHLPKSETAPVPVTITGNQTSGYGFNPPTVNVTNGGSVQFIAPQALWVWTYVSGGLANVFTGQQNDHEPCSAGGNNIFALTSQYAGATILIVGTAPNATAPPPPSDTTATLHGTIHVGN
jgi:hypothetical protein